MKFRTEYNPEIASELLYPSMPAVLIGSCFTDSIGARMRDCRWPSVANPCGVLYNPASIANLLTNVRQHRQRKCAQRDNALRIMRQRRLFVSWLTDSKINGASEADVAGTLVDRLSAMRSALSVAGVIIVTFGTSWIYELAESSGYVVSNCHKFPAKYFERRRLEVDEIVSIWKSAAANLKTLNPNLRIIFTVSPIRHLKDGFEGNARSKAILVLACEKLCSE